MRSLRAAWAAIVGDSTAGWTLIFGLFGALPLVLLTPPLQVADEPQHFARAYALGEGQMMGRRHGGRAGAMLPASISDMVHRALGTTALDADRSLRAQPLAASLAELSRPLRPRERRFFDFTGAAAYWPLPYLPQTLAIVGGRRLGLGPLALLYAARLGNALAAVALLVAAVRVMPVAREALALVGLLPMALYQYASASPDALTIATALFFTALAGRALVAGWTWRAAVAAAAAAATFCPLKPVYAPLLLLALVPDAFRRTRRAGSLVAHGAILAVALGATALWMHAAAAVTMTRAAGADPRAQAALALADPARFATVLAGSFAGEAELLFEGMVGVFGWHAVALPPLLQTLVAAGLVMAACISHPGDRRLPRAAGLWQLSLVAAGVMLVEAALYLTWNKVGSPFVEGVQGRYFVPMLGAFALALHILLGPRSDASTRSIRRGVLALVPLQILVTDATIAAAFKLF